MTLSRTSTVVVCGPHNIERVECEGCGILRDMVRTLAYDLIDWAHHAPRNGQMPNYKQLTDWANEVLDGTRPSR